MTVRAGSRPGVGGRRSRTPKRAAARGQDPKIAYLQPDTANLDAVLAVLRELREHRTLAELRRIFREGYEQSGYRLVALFDGDVVVTVAGFRILTNSAVGRHLYVDDLVTRMGVRSAGYGAALLEHLVDLARQESCSQVTLDSGNHRVDAHRFYEREGLVPTDLHFRIAVEGR